MVRKRIIWSRRASLEFKEVLAYYNHRNKSSSYSKKLFNLTHELLDSLSKSPEIGRLTSNKKTRVIHVRAYAVFYDINEDTIAILSFWDARQDQKNLKL